VRSPEIQHGVMGLSRVSAGLTLLRNSLKSGLRFCADWTCVAAAIFPCPDRLTSSGRASIHSSHSFNTFWRQPPYLHILLPTGLTFNA